jgi:hypothetical protein
VASPTSTTTPERRAGLAWYLPAVATLDALLELPVWTSSTCARRRPMHEEQILRSAWTPAST